MSKNATLVAFLALPYKMEAVSTPLGHTYEGKPGGSYRLLAMRHDVLVGRALLDCLFWQEFWLVLDEQQRDAAMEVEVSIGVNVTSPLSLGIERKIDGSSPVYRPGRASRSHNCVGWIWGEKKESDFSY